jgi:hypothetical protein
VFSAVLEGVLRKLMASSSPDWHKVADTMRQLVQQAASDNDKLRHYRCGPFCILSYITIYYL